MKFTDIKPYVRYVRYLKIDDTSFFGKVLPLDARLFYTLEGRGKIQVADEIIELLPHSVIYINSGIPYTLMPCDVCYLGINFDFTSSAKHIRVPVPPVRIEKAEGFVPFEKVEFSDTTSLNEMCFIEGCYSMEPYFKEMEREFSRKSLFYEEKNSSQITAVLVELLRRKEQNASYSYSTRFDAENIAEYVRTHLTENITNQKLAEIFHFHPNYLSNAFCKYFGKPVHRYILELRILKAISLLEAGGASIDAIAQSVGFSDSNYFSRYFKQFTGVSPRRYLQCEPKSKKGE